MQKSIALGRDVYVAAFPAYGIGMGVEQIAHLTKLRFCYNSVELPLTLSKRIEFSNGKQLILSGTVRAAYDLIDSDLHIIRSEFMHYEFDYYNDQPQLKSSRTAYMGHVEYSPNNFTYFSIQLGGEHIKVKSAESWEPIVYIGVGVYLNRVGKPYFKA